MGERVSRCELREERLLRVGERRRPVCKDEGGGHRESDGSNSSKVGYMRFAIVILTKHDTI